MSKTRRRTTEERIAAKLARADAENQRRSQPPRSVADELRLRAPLPRPSKLPAWVTRTRFGFRIERPLSSKTNWRPIRRMAERKAAALSR